MKLLNKNRELLEKRFSSVLEKLENTDEQSVMKFDDQGEIFYDFQGGRVYPYGQKNKDLLIDRWLSRMNTQDSGCYGLMGFGGGDHVEKLLEKSSKATVYFLAERDAAWLREVFSKKDCSKILADPRFFLTTGDVTDQMFKCLDDVHLRLVGELGYLMFSPTFQLFQGYYKSFLEAFERNVTVAKQMQQTNIQDSAFWQENTLKNLDKVLFAPDVSVMQGMFEGKPVVLVGAGPSLDESYDFLREVHDHAVIVCVNTAYRALYNQGIKPHITVAVDPRESTFLGYKGCDTEGVYLICTSFVNSKVIESFAGRAFTWSNPTNILYTYLRRKSGVKSLTNVPEKGTVAACIPHLAKLWGSTKICLVGQDLAVAADGKNHTKDSFYGDHNVIWENLEKCKLVEGNSGGKVPTEERLHAYLMVFNELVRANPELEFINTAPHGAKITGVPYKDYHAAKKWIGKKGCKRVNGEIKKIYEEKSFSEKEKELVVKNSVGPVRAYAEALLNQLYKASIQLLFLGDKAKEATFEQSKGYKKAVAHANAVNELLDKFKDVSRILFDGQAKDSLYRYLEKTRNLKGVTPQEEMVLKNKEYYSALIEGCETFYQQLQQAKL